MRACSRRSTTAAIARRVGGGGGGGGSPSSIRLVCHVSLDAALFRSREMRRRIGYEWSIMGFWRRARMALDWMRQ